MSKDEMSDDARFDAFLRGEGELARRLQAMPQPSPSAELDAAILGKVRASMAPVVREAANDPVAPGPRQRGLGLRWRVPAGIAATVLVGLFARQSYETRVSAVQVSLSPQERAEAAIARARAAPAATPAMRSAPAARTASPTPPAELPVSAQATPRPQPQLQKPASRARAPEPVVREDASRAEAAPAPPASVPVPIAAPSNDSLERTAPDPAPVRANLAATGGLYTAAQWITRMETLVREGEELAAACEWIMFRQRYPEYAVPPGLAAKMRELTEPE